MTGVWILAGVLVVATAFGMYRRATDGRMREAGTGLPLSVGDDAPPADVATPDRRHHGGEVLSAEQIGTELGSQATFVQFSSAFCQPCRATRLLVDDLTRGMPGVAHVEIDAESHMDLVRHLDIRRTPTLFLLDEHGAIRKRATGLPRKSDLVAALAQVV